jgi:hypothetical protein
VWHLTDTTPLDKLFLYHSGYGKTKKISVPKQSWKGVVK